MEKRIIGSVTDEEKEQIESLYERKNGLVELMYSLNQNTLLSEEAKSSIYDKLVLDMGKTEVSFDKWWSDMQQKYQWISPEGYSYFIDFHTNEIMLDKNEEKSCAC